MENVIQLFLADPTRSKNSEFKLSLEKELGKLHNELINLVAVGEENNANRLRALEILGIAQVAIDNSVTAAKKKRWSLAFFDKNEPTNLNLISNEKIRKGALKQLIKIKAKWVDKYALNLLHDYNFADQHEALSEWLRINHGLNQTLTLFKDQELAISNLYELIEKLIKKNQVSVTSDTFRLILEIFINNNIIFDVKKLLKLANTYLALNNLAPISTHFIESLDLLGNIEIEKNDVSKFINNVYEKFYCLAPRLVNEIPSSEVTHYLRDLDAKYCRLINPKDKDKITKKYPNTKIFLEQITFSKESFEDDLVEIASIIFEAGESSLVQAISETINRYGIKASPSRGSICEYDPITQHSIDDKNLRLNHVEILKEGFAQTRNNGTLKVIKKAIVRGVTND